jgi:hypothetical protein
VQPPLWGLIRHFSGVWPELPIRSPVSFDVGTNGNSRFLRAMKGAIAQFQPPRLPAFSKFPFALNVALREELPPGDRAADEESRRRAVRLRVDAAVREQLVHICRTVGLSIWSSSSMRRSRTAHTQKSSGQQCISYPPIQ